ncbi:hypothetical protein N181_02140 [Sinorhizobium fredii USDA 205]|nr:hypothetical protein N181_02140 [Sinorhizobium fredii USDA 205]
MGAIGVKLPGETSIPPSALPGISPTRGEIRKMRAPCLLSATTISVAARAGVAHDGASPISPLVREMPGREEGGVLASDKYAHGWSGAND